MEPHELDNILGEVGDSCWRCGSTFLRAISEPCIGSIVICDECGHEHYFTTKAIPDVPANLQ